MASILFAKTSIPMFVGMFVVYFNVKSSTQTLVFID